MSRGSGRVARRVLIVDGCPASRRLVSSWLSSVSDVVAEEADNAWSALRMIVKREPDLIILDMNLPVLDGYMTTRMVRAWGGRFADLPILALTPAVEPDAREQCLRVGASDHLATPLIDPIALRAKVDAALSCATATSAP